MLCILVVAPAEIWLIAEEGEGKLSSVTNAILPVDLPNLFLSAIHENQREPDGLLHCSTDLVSPLRMVQLRAVGAPTVDRPIAHEIRLMHGTIWHDWFHEIIEESGIKFLSEIPLNLYLPEGWGGTADWLFWNPELEAWVLGDLKTTRGEALFFINRDGAKTEHLWQLSAYWHALEDAGIPLVKGFGILYWPMNDTNDAVEVVPTVQDCMPVERDELHAHMAAVKASVDAYKVEYDKTGQYINKELAPMPEREQKYYWNKTQGVFDVKLVPSWYERYCDYDEDLCPRSKTEKIGHYLVSGHYVARKGYETIIPEIRPTEAELGKRRNK